MNIRSPLPVDQWRGALRQVLRDTTGPLRDVIVLSEVDSTQDAARRMNAAIGDVVVAARQTHGRGRLGRSWHDSEGQGVAMTLIMPHDRPERVSIASAVAVHEAIVACAIDPVPFRIKWPNDVLANGRKIAGIIVEQTADRALIGVGVNVEQKSFAEPLQRSATSLWMEGVEQSRFTAMAILLRCFQQVWQRPDAQLVRHFAHADALTGTTCGFRIGEREVRGKVLRVDPMKGLAVLTEAEGEVWLAAATTTVIRD